jgi:hypothetical protein
MRHALHADGFDFGQGLAALALLSARRWTRGASSFGRVLFVNADGIQLSLENMFTEQMRGTSCGSE